MRQQYAVRSTDPCDRPSWSLAGVGILCPDGEASNISEQAADLSSCKATATRASSRPSTPNAARSMTAMGTCWQATVQSMKWG